MSGRFNRTLLLFFLLALAPAIKVAAQSAPLFSLEAERRNLTLRNASGEVVTTVPLGSLRQEVEIAGVLLQVSFGRIGSDDPVAILAPTKRAPERFTFAVGSKQVTMTRDAVVNLRFTAPTEAIISPGEAGKVTVDGVAAARPEPAAISTVKAPAIVNRPPQELRVELAADLPSTVPKAELLIPNPRFPVQLDRLAETARLNLWLPRAIYWSEPIAQPDPNPNTAPRAELGEIRLFETQGELQITDAQGTALPTQDGSVVPSGARVVTRSNGSAALLLGGVNSLRIAPDTALTIKMTYGERTRSTEVKLESGLLFCRLTREVGERQTFRLAGKHLVVTGQQGDFGMIARRVRDTVLVARGTFAVTGSDGKSLNPALTPQPGSLAYLSSATTSAFEQRRDIFLALATASELNRKITALLTRQSESKETLNPREIRYLQGHPSIEVAIRLSPENLPLLQRPQLLPPQEMLELLSLSANP